jgi:signal transduction histidine kinase
MADARARRVTPRDSTAELGVPIAGRPARWRTSKVLLTLAFASVGLTLVIAQIVGYVQWREVQATVDVIERNALDSVRLVQRMGLDVQRQRILIDRHIFEHEAGRMDEVEAQIAAVRADYLTAASAYGPLATFNGESEAWRQLARDIASLEPRMSSALERSRRNADAEAHVELAAAEPTYDAVERDVNDLVAINAATADRGLAAVEALQLRVLRLRMAMGGVALAFVALLGLWVTRTIGRRERLIERHAIALENRNRELDAFAGRVAHDLRGPLNTIKLSGSLLAEGAPEEMRTALILQRGVSQMEQLIEDLLTLSRLDGQAVGQVARTDAVAEVIGDDLGRVVREVGGTLRIDISPARVRCSEGLLRQVLWNLGENAVKYRRSDAALELEIVGRASESDYELRISDNALGMPPEEARAAFEPFFRGAHTRTIPGTGLGLAIVRRIIEANGGSVALESVAGRGTTIGIHLPRQA